MNLSLSTILLSFHVNVGFATAEVAALPSPEEEVPEALESFLRSYTDGHDNAHVAAALPPLAFHI
jgi:hypothetical protein